MKIKHVCVHLENLGIRNFTDLLSRARSVVYLSKEWMACESWRMESLCISFKGCLICLKLDVLCSWCAPFEHTWEDILATQMFKKTIVVLQHNTISFYVLDHKKAKKFFPKESENGKRDKEEKILTYMEAWRTWKL